MSWFPTPLIRLQPQVKGVPALGPLSLLFPLPEQIFQNIHMALDTHFIQTSLENLYPAPPFSHQTLFLPRLSSRYLLSCKRADTSPLVYCCIYTCLMNGGKGDTWTCLTFY